MIGPAVGEVDICFGVVGLLDAAIHLRAVEEAAQAIQFRYIDELPLDELLVVVVEVVLLLTADRQRFFESFVFVPGGYEPELDRKSVV